MPLIHEPDVRASIDRRLDALRADMRPRWGRMSVDQMLWHVNQAMEQALGRLDAPQHRAPLPRPFIKFVVLKMPWPRNAPTNPSFIPTSTHDFETERTRCKTLIEELTSRSLAETSEHPMFGRMSGRETSLLQAKHLDHHLRQFGV